MSLATSRCCDPYSTYQSGVAFNHSLSGDWSGVDSNTPAAVRQGRSEADFARALPPLMSLEESYARFASFAYIKCHHMSELCLVTHA